MGIGQNYVYICVDCGKQFVLNRPDITEIYCEYCQGRLNYVNETNLTLGEIKEPEPQGSY